jgi:hypothetical protein
VGAIAAYDAENGARGTVPRVAGHTQFAFATSSIDLAHHPLTREYTVRRRLNEAHEFMPDGALKTGIASGNLEIGIADAGKEHPNQSLVFAGWSFDVAKRHTAFFNSEGFH